jgi:hypothetical protein
MELEAAREQIKDLRAGLVAAWTARVKAESALDQVVEASLDMVVEAEVLALDLGRLEEEEESSGVSGGGDTDALFFSCDSAIGKALEALVREHRENCSCRKCRGAVSNSDTAALEEARLKLDEQTGELAKLRAEHAALEVRVRAAGVGAGTVVHPSVAL